MGREPEPTTITDLLAAWRRGDPLAQDELLALVYPQLRRIAGLEIRRQKGVVSLQVSDVVHEAYLRLNGEGQPDWENRAHLYRVAARAMRFVLVDYLRRKLSSKRGGRQDELSLETVPLISSGPDPDLLASMRRSMLWP